MIKKSVETCKRNKNNNSNKTLKQHFYILGAARRCGFYFNETPKCAKVDYFPITALYPFMAMFNVTCEKFVSVLFYRALKLETPSIKLA